MHRAIATAAMEMVGNPAQLGNQVTISKSVNAFVYGQVAFLESNGQTPTSVRFKGKTYALSGHGACYLVNTTSGAILFDTNSLGAAGTYV